VLWPMIKLPFFMIGPFVLSWILGSFYAAKLCVNSVIWNLFMNSFLNLLLVHTCY
jgi:hypothetical protein